MTRYNASTMESASFPRVSTGRQTTPLPEQPEFGQHFTDHMALMDWTAESGWHSPRITAYTPLSLDPAAAALHYALEVFEGLKAYRHPDGTSHLFRPWANAQRFQESAERLVLPSLPAKWFVAAAEALVDVDARWIPAQEEASLYLRPFLIATDAFLGLRVPRTALFAVIASPTLPYFSERGPLRMWLSSEHSRAGKGGTAAAKCGGNYASSLLAASIAADHGCDQVVFTDASTGRLIEEAGNMNLFLATRDGALITPPVEPASRGGTILAGITRDSVIQLARGEGLRVEERPVKVDEWAQGVHSGHITEAFATGTAAVVAPLGELLGESGLIAPATSSSLGPVGSSLRRRLTDIQFGFAPDAFGWMHRVGPTR